MTGADRYSDAISLLVDYHKHGEQGDPRLLSEAMVHATLALAAATALAVVIPLVGDSTEEVMEWARLIARSNPMIGRTSSTCCNGTGMADYASVPCPNPKCPALAATAGGAR